MDRRSSKTIKRYVLLWMLFVLFFSFGIFVFNKNSERILEKQGQELVVIYPENQSVLLENFSFYERELRKTFLTFWVCFMAGITGIMLSLFYFEKVNFKITRLIDQENLEVLYEQLENFRKGNYDAVSAFIMEKKAVEKGTEWYPVWESVKELGIYFSMLRERLDEEENSTKSLITDISHQLKTPLSSLRMSHELTQEQNLTEEERREFLEKEAQEIQKLELLLEELVNLSRLESHMISLHPKPASIKDTITEAVNQVFMKAHGKKIELQVELQEDVTLTHDSKWTVEAISNVLDNAIKYSEENTHILVR